MKRTALLAFALAASAFATVSHAIPFTVTAQLTGDPRSHYPDDIVVDVSITGDTDSNSVNWLVDLNSPLHPNAYLGAFAFNVVGGYSDYSFSNFLPVGWSITNGNNVSGSDGANFLFESVDPSGSSNNVTNTVNLTFTMTKNSGNFLESDFYKALYSCSNDVILGCGQLGAKARDLDRQGIRGGLDNGFAMGNYDRPNSVPEPGTLGMIGVGLMALGLVLVRRRRQSVK